MYCMVQNGGSHVQILTSLETNFLGKSCILEAETSCLNKLMAHLQFVLIWQSVVWAKFFFI